MTALIVLSSTTAQTRILPRTGAKPLIVTGMTLGLIAMLLLTRLSPSSSYVGGVLPSLLILGVGMGTIFAPAFGTATLNVDRHEAGVASAMVNTSQQVGGSVGTSLLSTLFASSAAAFVGSHPGTPDLRAAAMVHGYTTAFWWSVGIFAVGMLVAAVVFPNRVRPAHAMPEPAPATE
jgi:MFS family permease